MYQSHVKEILLQNIISDVMIRLRKDSTLDANAVFRFLLGR